jgi:energy-coupling factor transporter ATP-binding protein EcfA2
MVGIIPYHISNPTFTTQFIECENKLPMPTTENTSPNTPFTQNSAMHEIVKWSEIRPDWQREALKRLAAGTSFDEIDLDRLEAICVGEITDFDPLTSNDVAPQNSSSEAVAISSVSSVVGVNALASDQTLDIAKTGITIVYGDNGSGKSGYCRVLKNACRTRDEKFLILSNIDDANEPPQSAMIDFVEGSNDKAFSWSPETIQEAALAKVSIFDSRSANTHVQAENKLAYTPFPMRILQGMGDLCDALKERLDRRVDHIKAKTPLAISNHQLAHDTPAGQYLQKLSEKSDLSLLKLLCELKADEQTKLENLRNDLSQDPQKVINSLSAQKQRVQKLLTAIQILHRSVSVESFTAFQQLDQEYVASKEVSALASKQLFEASPLPEVGSATWKALWEAARTFSDDVAYPTKQFPTATPNKDRCVLCQQELSEDAVERQSKFEAFVKSTTQANELRCQNLVKERSVELKESLLTPEAVEAAFILLGDELSRSQIASDVKAWLEQANAKLSALFSNDQIPSIDAQNPIDSLNALLIELGERITQLKSVQDPEALAKLNNERRALEDRQKLANIRADVEAEISRLAEIANLKQKTKTTARAAVTKKNKELSELLITGALRSRFAREMTKLDLNANPMELKKTRDSKAQSFFRVEFVGYPGQPLGEILSEGEHRCVALAAFLAELVTSRDHSGIVFDDPMSSLDHIYRERVAKRLVEEAHHRQVVIFTHDLGFLFEVKREAESNDIAVHYQHVKRRMKTPGHVTNDLPLKAKEAPALVGALRTELKDIKGQIDTVSETKRVILVKGVIEQLREAWDQVIADFIAPVLGRFDNQIKGNSLFKLLVLTQDDVDLIKAARGRLSEGLHNSSGALNPAEVSHDKLSSEVTVIHEFIESLKKRPTQSEPRIRGL